jgi:hypothetical protein
LRLAIEVPSASRLKIIGSIGFGDNVMIIRADALPRLLDNSKPAVVMGSVSGAPRSGMRRQQGLDIPKSESKGGQ